MYYTQSTVCQGMDSQINFSVVAHGRMPDLPRGAKFFIFFCGGGGGLATRGVAMRLLGGFGGMFLRNFFLNGANWWVLEHIFINFLLSKSLKISFFYKNNYKL